MSTAATSYQTLAALFPGLSLYLGAGYPIRQPHATYGYCGGSIQVFHYPNGDGNGIMPDIYSIHGAEIVGPHVMLASAMQAY